MFMTFLKGPRRRTSVRLSANHEPAGEASSASSIGPRDVSSGEQGTLHSDWLVMKFIPEMAKIKIESVFVNIKKFK